jgi:6-phosphogluconolactonase
MTAPLCRCALVWTCVFLAACHGGGGGGGGGPPPPTTYTVGGTLSGLSGTGLVLRNNAGSDLAVAPANGTFTFATALVTGSAYNVTVATQPSNPSQTCSVTGGAGTVGTANVSNVQIACTTNSFTVGATVTGLDADGLVLQNNGGNDLSVASDGTVTFPGQTLSGDAYAVTVKTQPTVAPLPLPAQFCTVTNGSGTVGASDVNVAIACAAPVYKYLYVSNSVSNDISAYSVDATTGTLTAVPGAPFPADVRPNFAIPELSGKFVYVSNGGDGSTPPRISAYSVDATTGVLTQLAASPFELSVTPQPPGSTFSVFFAPFMHRSGAFAYVAGATMPTGASTLYGEAINSLTGELTEINGFPMDVGFSLSGEGYDAGGRILFLTTHAAGATNGEIRTFSINAPSGTLTPVGAFPTVDMSPSLPFMIPGDNFVLTLGRLAGTMEVFAIGKSNGVPNGVLTPVGAPVPSGPSGSRPSLMAFNRRNNVLYVTNGTSGGATPSLATFRIDANTGTLTAIGTPVSTDGAAGAALLHPSGRFLLQYNASITAFQRFAIDPTTFAPTLQPNVTQAESGSFTVDISGRYLYKVNSQAGTVSSYRIDTTTGDMTLVNTVPAGTSPITVSPFGFQQQ